MRLHFASILVAAGIFGTTAVCAQEGPAGRFHERAKAGWEWTDEERIAARLDPIGVHERLEAHRAELGKVPGSAGRLEAQAVVAPEAEFVIDGLRNPELFLPFELFTHLLYGIDAHVSAGDRDRFTARYERAIAQLGVSPSVFWTELAIATHPYLDRLEQSAKLADSLENASSAERRHMQAELQAMPTSLCRLRASALDAARRRFGQPAFDRFLYTAVAPSLHVASRTPSSEEASGLQMLAEGCP